MRAPWLAVVLLITMAAVGCGRLGFESHNPAAGDGGVGGSGGSAGADASVLDASDDASVMLDAGSMADAATPDASTTDASNDAAIDTCGNGTIEAPEQCDDGVESVTCDRDCTFAVCGDDTLNITAGEGCDDGVSSATCSVTCQPFTCRAGCTCEWYRGARYMLCPEQLDWPGAHTACARESMRIVRIDSATEQTWLRFRTLQDGLPKFHLGGSDLAAEGTWLWDDNNPFWLGLANGIAIGGLFTAWAQGEPNAFVVNENCAEVQSVRGWNDCVCDLPKAFVCKEYHAPPTTCGNGIVEAGEACDVGGKSNTCDADCSLAVCGDGIVNRMRGEVCDDAGTTDYCSADCMTFQCPAGCSCFDANGEGYALCPSTATYRDAAVLCGRAGMMLARVVDSTVDQQLRSRATLASMGELWIGGFDIDQADNWVWNNLAPLWIGTAGGTPQGYTHFTAGAPSGMPNRDCLTLLANGEWQDVDCTSTRAYACQRL